MQLLEKHVTLSKGETMRDPDRSHRMRQIRIAGSAALLAFAMQSSLAAEVSIVLEPKSGSSVRGQLKVVDAAGGVLITGEVSGLTPGQHGIHVHAVGDCSAPDAESAGGHFNPTSLRHGGPKGREHHAGDLGNIEANASGVAKVNITGADLSLAADRPDGIRGRALVIHAQPDDEKTDPSGNSGARVACGVIPR
jgi:Cu-Zn family superoxide dismutase